MKAAFKILLVIALVAMVAGTVGCAKKKKLEMYDGAKQEETMTAEERAYQEQRELMRQRDLEERRRIAAEVEAEKRRREMEREKLEMAREDAMSDLKMMIHFDFDSYQLKPDARDILQRKAQILKEYEDWKMVIAGYCDERGTEEYNLALGERRARAAYEFLVLLGVDPGRMSIISYGEEDPIDPGHNEVAWAKNRRDEFRIVQ